jgi:uracil-DNA glycosylase
MPGSFDKMVVAAYRGKGAAEILAAPPDALKGVSAADAKHLDDAFGIKTVRDLAESPYFRWAQALLAAGGEVLFDPGPPHDWENFFDRAPLDHYLNHPKKNRFRLDFGPVFYRGRLDGTARVVLVGQDPSHNEIVGHRVFVGSSGQRMQGFLAKLGITRSYVFLNTSLFSVRGQVDNELKGILLENPILSYRNEFLDRLIDENPVEVVVMIGNGAEIAVDNWPGKANVTVVKVTHPAADNNQQRSASWNAALATLSGVVTPDEDGQPDPTPYGLGFTAAQEPAIPRFDLPFGMPEWHGSGSRTKRDGDKKIVWTAP